MIQQWVMFLFESVFWKLVALINIPLSFWEGAGRTYQAIKVLIDWTPAIPYAPYAALAFTVTVAMSLYVALYAASLVFKLINWVSRIRGIVA